MVNHQHWLARERILLAFEEEWLDTRSVPSLQDFIDAQPESVGVDVLRELIIIDAEQRRRRQMPADPGRIGRLQAPGLDAALRAELAELAERHGGSPPPPAPRGSGPRPEAAPAATRVDDPGRLPTIGAIWRG